MLILLAQGYTLAPDAEPDLRALAPQVRGVDQVTMLKMLRLRLFVPVDSAQRQARFDRLRDVFFEMGERDVWERNVGPQFEELVR